MSGTRAAERVGHGLVAGIQARMSSARLPGKVLADVAGKPLLLRIFERVRAARSVEDAWILTSDDASDEPIAAFCAAHGIPCMRGSLPDVLSRYLELLRRTGARWVARVTGDCALVDPAFLDLQSEALRRHDGDWIHPIGIDPSECSGVLGGQGVLSARALLDASRSEDALDREHVGSFHLARESTRFRIVGLVIDERYRRPGWRLCVDEDADLELVRRVYEHFAPAHDSLTPLAEVIDFLAHRPQLARINAGVRDSPPNREHRRLLGACRPALVGSLSP